MANLSVIIPCYNNGEYLSEMLDCCLRQTYSDWEVIVVDDGSTDNTTPNIVEEYVAKDSRIKFFRRERTPKGSVVCRNIGFEHSVGDYIIHFDADDLISDTCFEKRVAFMESNPDCDYASFPAKSFSVGEELPTLSSNGRTYGVPVSGDILTDFLTCNYSFSVWCNIYKRSAIENFQWDERVLIYTDFSYILPMILAGLKHKFSNIGEVDYYYRVSYGNNNMCANFVSQEKCDSTKYLFEKVIKSLLNRDDAELRLKQFREFILLQSERLISSNQVDELSALLDVCGKYYPSSFIDAVKSTSKIVSPPINNRWKKLWLYVLLSVRFNSYRYKQILKQVVLSTIGVR